MAATAVACGPSRRAGLADRRPERGEGARSAELGPVRDHRPGRQRALVRRGARRAVLPDAPPLHDLRAGGRLPVCKVAPAILLFAGYEPNRRTGHGAVAAVVQQRLTDVADLSLWLHRLRPLPGAKGIRILLDDIGSGAQSLAEVEVRRACRRFGVALPVSQQPRFDRAGRRRYTDCEWKLPDGRTLVLEVDGAFHDDFLQAAADRARNRKLTTADRLVISCSAHELRHDPASVMEDLIALGVPRAKRVG